jgi:hypothetical protein
MAAMRGSPGASLVFCLAVTAASVAGCGDDEPMDGTTLGQAVDEVLVGSFAARFDETVVGGGVVAQGASLSKALVALGAISRSGLWTAVRRTVSRATGAKFDWTVTFSMTSLIDFEPGCVAMSLRGCRPRAK